MKSNTVQILTTVLSHAAVLAGVVFLVIELKQNSAIALSQMTQERALSYVDQHVSYSADEDFAELYARVFFRCDFDSVTPKEWDQITRNEEAERARQRDVWFLAKNGMIDPKLGTNSLDQSARRLPLWEWLKVAFPQDAVFHKEILEHSNSDDFQPDYWGRPFHAKFKEWVKDKKSPHEI